MFKRKQPRLSESKLFEDDRMRLGAFLYAIENGFFNKDLIRLARGIDRRKLAGLPWSVDYLVAFTGGLMIPVGHPTAYKELQNSLKQAIKDMEEGIDILEEDEWDEEK